MQLLQIVVESTPSPWVPAVSALGGTIVGGLAAYLSSHSLKKQEWKQERLKGDLSKREALYTEVLKETQRIRLIIADGAMHSVGELHQLFALRAQVDLLSSERVRDAVKVLVESAVEELVADNEETTGTAAHAMDAAVEAFIGRCREELESLRDHLNRLVP